MQTIYSRTLLVFFIFFHSSTDILVAKSTERAFAIGSLVAGAIAGVAAVAGACYYLFSETAEQVCESAELALHELEFFDVAIRGFCSLHQVHSPYVVLSDITYSEINELNKVAVDFIQRGIRAYEYIDRLENVVLGLKTSKEVLAQYVSKLEKEASLSQDYVLLKRMRGLYKDIDERFPYVKLYYTFMDAHRRFFYLYNELEVINVKYAQESNAMARHSHDPVYLAYAIKQAVGIHAINGQFRLIEYKNMLDKDVDALKYALKTLEYEYPVLYDRANQWITFIKRVRGVILADYEYTAELAEQRRQAEHDAVILLQQQAALKQSPTNIIIIGD